MSIWHLIILLVVIMLVFGTRRITNLGPDLGSAIRGFKKSLSGEDETGANTKAPDTLQADLPRADSTVRQEQPEPVSKS